MPARTLTLTPASKNGTAAHATQVVLYARVSSKDQEKEGFSIPAQLRLLRDYASNKGFVIAQEFTDVETAKASGRTNFNEMLLYLKKHQTACRTILVEKTDRLYRNIKDSRPSTNSTSPPLRQRERDHRPGSSGRTNSSCTASRS